MLFDPVYSSRMASLVLSIAAALLLLLITQVHAQPPVDTIFYEWASRFGNNANDEGRGIAVDTQGNTYITGAFEGTVNFGNASLNGAGEEDIFVAKVAPDGDTVWSRRFGGAEEDIGRNLTVDSDGNIYLVGTFEGTVNFGPATLTSAGRTDMFILKLDTDGNPLWVNGFGDLAPDESYDVAVDSLNNVYMIGSFRRLVDFGGIELRTNGGDDIVVLRLTPEGLVRWARSFGSGDFDQGLGIGIDPQNNVYATGYFSDTANFGSTQLTAQGDTDAFVLKLTSTGAIRWAKSFGGADSDQAVDLAFDGNNGLYIGGYFTDAATFENLSLTSRGGRDNFVTYLEPTFGTVRWAKSIGSTGDDRPHGLAVDSLRNVYLTGSFENNLQFQNGLSVITSSNGEEDMFILKMDVDGNYVWGDSFGGDEADRGYAIVIDPRNFIYVIGLFRETVDFDPDDRLAADQVSLGSNDIFILKLRQPSIIIVPVVFKGYTP